MINKKSSQERLQACLDENLSARPSLQDVVSKLGLGAMVATARAGNGTGESIATAADTRNDDSAESTVALAVAADGHGQQKQVSSTSRFAFGCFVVTGYLVRILWLPEI